FPVWFLPISRRLTPRIPGRRESSHSISGDPMPQRIPWKKPVALPVKVARAERGDLDLSLKVNGYAEAYSTVTVQSRVSGQLQAVAFTPGGRVQQGEVIARIDPSLLQAQLDQARGNLAKDQAQLANAEQVLRRYTPMLAKGYVAKTDYDGYRANVGIYAASVKADQA